MSPIFHFPSDIHYTCRCDGLCCRDSWEIRVEPDAADRVLSTDWRSCCDLGAKEETAFEQSPSNPNFLVFKRRHDACVFLGDDNRCRLHARYGPDSKPYVCQRFPFHFVETPGGVYVGFSFACPSVLHQDGAPAEDSREEALRVFSLKLEPDKTLETPRLDSALSVSWEEYSQIERALDAILAREDQSVALCLVAGHAWLSILRRMIAAAGTAAIPHYIQKTTSDGFAQAFAIARKPVARPQLKRMLLGSFVSFRNSVRSNPSRFFLPPLLVFENMRHWLRIGSLPLKPLEKRVPYKKFSPTPALLEDAATQALLRRYYRHALFRKDLATSPDVFWGFCYLVLTHGLIEYYAAGLKALGEADIGMALSLVEKYFVHHSSFGRNFLGHPAIALIFQRVFERPNFAHTIALG
ncbi:MAG: hypothetical protein NTX50_28680 [Candidatus Sumerlaeota bacterium]|nr:hypothetical protein [Candidatus Sumerlaeota bacterium]